MLDSLASCAFDLSVDSDISVDNKVDNQLEVDSSSTRFFCYEKAAVLSMFKWLTDVIYLVGGLGL